MEHQNPIVRLQNALEKSDCSIEALQCLFYETSKEIINHYVLQIDTLYVELKELEFYFFDADHQDPYVHKNEIQKKSSNFLYVHEAWGNRGGLDLTFGNGVYYGGILIRGMKHNEQYVAGPALLRNHIVDQLGIKVDSYSELQDYFESIQEKISLKPRIEPLEHELVHSFRVGLGNQNSEYSNALYRFLDMNYMGSPKQFFISEKKPNDILKTTVISSLSEISQKVHVTNEIVKLQKEMKNNNILMTHIENFKKNCL